MDSNSYAIKIIPDLTIDDKYAAIIENALNRITSFTSTALSNDRISELYLLERSNLGRDAARQILAAKGKLVVGFQFEIRADASDDNFRVYVKKVTDENKNFKFYLTPTVQEIMLQLISLEDRRSVAIFSMLNSSIDIGYRILTTLYSNQLKRLKDRTSSFVQEGIKHKLDKLAVAKASEDAELWQEDKPPVPVSGQPKGSRPGSQDNLLMVLADDGTFDEINQYVGHIVSRSDRIREKREVLERNPDMPPEEIYEQMVREDLDQLENCYARMHIYMKAFYKNKDRRPPTQNKVLRQFFAGEIENITGETGLLEDLLALGQEDYFKNLARHKELS
ncbi:MAG: hypothetical protein HY912_04755 [Desulfomonile tiedjei]|uniref:Uncharacterized protein n=1 Tax=Desulfomonile tiedjei TaxID=2358 RepID=A0A9D6V155_9BACT|nr:hypothetical protein [Desulfomonile tiedjei]